MDISQILRIYLCKQNNKQAAGQDGSNQKIRYKYRTEKENKTMTDIRKMNEQEAANVAGGVEGYNYGNGWRTVKNLQGGYLALRTAPSFNYENEVIHNGPKNGQLVQITGGTVQGTGINGVPATYVWVYSPDFGVSGYANAYFIG